MAITCSSCNAPLSAFHVNSGILVPCPTCAAEVRADVFPAMFRAEIPTQKAEMLLIDGESSCYYHPAKKAVVPCDSCGRFLCALCDMELRDRHLCPACLESGEQKGKLEEIERSRTRYDVLAFQIALAGCVPFCWYFLIFTAPVVIYLSIRYWSAPLSVLPFGRWRFVVAFVLALGQLGLIMLVVIMLIAGAFA